jgi:hypothetical protein
VYNQEEQFVCGLRRIRKSAHFKNAEDMKGKILHWLACGKEALTRRLGAIAERTVWGDCFGQSVSGLQASLRNIDLATGPGKVTPPKGPT